MVPKIACQQTGNKPLSEPMMVFSHWCMQPPFSLNELTRVSQWATPQFEFFSGGQVQKSPKVQFPDSTTRVLGQDLKILKRYF